MYFQASILSDKLPQFLFYRAVNYFFPFLILEGGKKAGKNQAELCSNKGIVYIKRKLCSNKGIVYIRRNSALIKGLCILGVTLIIKGLCILGGTLL